MWLGRKISNESNSDLIVTTNDSLVFNLLTSAVMTLLVYKKFD